MLSLGGMGPNVRNIQHTRGRKVCLENKNISKFEFSKIWVATASSVKWPGNKLDNRKIVVRSPVMEGLFSSKRRDLLLGPSSLLFHTYWGRGGLFPPS